MTFTAKCWKPWLGAHAIAASLPAGCGTGGSGSVVIQACPLVVNRGAGIQDARCLEVETLPAGSALA